MAYAGHENTFCKRNCATLGDHLGNGPYVTGASMPTRNSNAFHAAREQRWERDGDALKSLSTQGFNPPTLDGLADIADRATHPIEIEHGKLYGKDAAAVAEVSEALAG